MVILSLAGPGLGCGTTLPGVAPSQGVSTVTDIDGNTYATVRIGDQWWMVENLRVTRNPEGDPIRSYIYRHDERLLPSYGRLYSWDVAMNGSSVPGARGIAPEGWHIPSDDDWNRLFQAVGGDSVAGGILKQVGLSHWDSPNAGANDSVGFAGLPGGGFDGRLFEGMGIGGHFWSSTGSGPRANAPTLHRDTPEIARLTIPKSFAISLRCVKDTDQ